LQAHFYFAYAAVKTLKVRSSKNKKELSISLVAQHKRTVVNLKQTQLAAYNSMQAITAGSVLIWKFVFLL
jgi:hypothetical protein